ncbi:MAG: hypothetical protein NC517_06615 [Firmicutes bacterium]|nr:hypothetical protein [Bacillota bacterium]
MAVGNMLRVLKGNQEMLISPANKEKYLKMGYSVIDEDGSVLEQGTKSEGTVRHELEAANRRIKELEEENAKLKAKTSRRGKKDGEQEGQEEDPGQDESKLTGE